MVGVVQGIISGREQTNSLSQQAQLWKKWLLAPMQITLTKMEIRQTEDQFPSKIVPECSSKAHLSKNRALHSFLLTNKNCMGTTETECK